MKTTLFVLAGLAVATAAAAQETHAHEGGLGTVRFDTSCSAQAQPHITQAATLLHSFEFVKARDAFNKALELDPACGIAMWGVALSNWGNPFAPGIKPAAATQAGGAAVQRGRSA